MRNRTIALLASLAVVALLTAGCGGGGGTTSPEPDVKDTVTDDRITDDTEEEGTGAQNRWGALVWNQDSWGR